MKVSSRVTGVTCLGEIVSGFRDDFGPFRGSGVGANHLELIANGLGLVENGLEPTAQGRRCERE